jgi:hypothetical protein
MTRPSPDGITPRADEQTPIVLGGDPERDAAALDLLELLAELDHKQRTTAGPSKVA